MQRRYTVTSCRVGIKTSPFVETGRDLYESCTKQFNNLTIAPKGQTI
ncbi:hypothetical protein L1278_000086 [Pontibacter sp. HSC-36F09]|nr:hypothetical protein [Pontibacter sp. HSC-36F09]